MSMPTPEKLSFGLCCQEITKIDAKVRFSVACHEVPSMGPNLPFNGPS